MRLLPLLIIVLGCEPSSTPFASPKDEPCEELTCIDGVEVFFSANEWRAGTYSITVELDDTEVLCDVQLPVDVSTDSIDCADGVWVGVDDVLGLWGLHVDDTELDYVRVILTNTDSVLGEVGFAPDYWNIRPNGDECPEACEYATETIDVRGAI